MEISKKFKHSVLAISMLLVFAFIALTGCGGNQTESLTKEEYAEAMNATYEVMVDAATSDLSTFKMARAISDDDYIDLTAQAKNEGFLLSKNLIKFVSGILKNKDYKLTNDLIVFKVNIGKEYNVKMQLNFKLNWIYTKLQLCLDNGEYQYIEAKIHYDFIFKFVIAYEIDYVSVGEYIDRIDRFTYSPSLGTKMLAENTNSYEENKIEKKAIADSFYSAKAVQTEYDFTQELNDAQS